MNLLQVGMLVVLLCLRQTSGKPPSRRDNVNAGQCGSGLACGPECQKFCLTQHNYYRALHNLSPVRCDPDLAESAQAWTDIQAQKGQLKRSPWRNLGQLAESISWKQWGWSGMADTRAAVPSAVRSWYSEKKGRIRDRTSVPENFQTIVRPDITRLGCGIHVIPGDGTYVTSHYGAMPGGNVLNDEIQIPAARDPEPACQIKSGQREKCGNIPSPYVTPDVCIKAGCCYDDVFRDEPDVNWYSSEGSTWCYKGKNNEKEDQAMATSQEITLATTSNPVTQVSRNKYDKATSMENAVDTTNSSLPLDKNYKATSMESTTVAPTNVLANHESLENDGDVPPTGFFKDCVDQHNKLRAKHGVPPLKWSDKLAANALETAKMNADIGEMKHSSGREGEDGEGENIYYFDPPRPECEGPKVGNCYQCREVVNNWYSEIKDYDFAAGKSKGGYTTHFTQVIWASTTRVGMATATGPKKVFVVGRYLVKGNWGEKEAYIKNVPPPNGPGSTPAPAKQPTPESTEGTTSLATPAPAKTAPPCKGTTSANTASPTRPSLKPSANSKLVINCKSNYAGSCYYFNEQGTKWTENREECKKKGSDLVSMETEGEWSFLKDKIQGLSNPLRNEWHIGLKKEGSTWKWVNGAPLTITHWQRGQPSGDGPYGLMAKNYPPEAYGEFNDIADYVRSGYICEEKQVPRPWRPHLPTGAMTPAAATTSGPTTTSGGEETATAVTAAPGGGQTEKWMNVGSCGQGLTCGPDCQLLCLKLHNYYRKLHDAPPMSCDPELAKSAQEWTDEQARVGKMHHSDVTAKYTESISQKSWGWDGMEKMEGAIPGATRGWYSEIKNDYNYATGKGNGQAVGHFMHVVWKGETKIGCGLNIKPKDGTYVTAHYAPAPKSSELAPNNVLPRKDPEQKCDIRSSEREDCNAELKAPFVTPEECLNAGCCYDDMFMSEPGVKPYDAKGKKWCFVPKGGARSPSTKGPGAEKTV